MLKNGKLWSLLALGLFVVGGMLLSSPAPVQARPQYMKEFAPMYPKVKEAAVQKCNVCHFGKSKKNRNNYGMDFAKILDGKNVKDAGQITEALKKTEEKKSAVEGQTYGDLLKEGKLPATGWEAPAEEEE